MRPTAPVVKIMLDRERTLRFDFNAFCAFEKQTGKSALSGEVWLKPDATTTRALLWAAFLHEDSTLKVSDVGAMIHVGNLKEVTDKIQEAATAASPEPTGDAEGGDPNVPLPAG